MTVVAIDTEGTGLDHWHGTEPYMVTSCTPEGTVIYWEWVVDPRTRKVLVVEDDVVAIRNLIDKNDCLIFQNPKYDGHTLSSIGIELPWAKVHDTLTAAHLLASNQPHDLTSLAMIWLGQDIQPWENRLQEACQRARSVCRSRFKDWAIAKKGRPDMPSAKGDSKSASRGVESEKPWKFDTWLPRAIADEHGWIVPADDCDHAWTVASDDQSNGIGGERCRRCNGHHWWTVASEYANVDSQVTVALWPVMRAEMESRDLWEIYLAQMAALPVATGMERGGVTGSMKRLSKLSSAYKVRSAESANVLVNLAATYEVPCEDCALVPSAPPTTVLGREQRARRKRLGVGQRDVFACPTCGGSNVMPYRLQLPKGGAVNGSLRRFAFDVLKLPPVVNEGAKTNTPTLNAATIEHYLTTLPARSPELLFLRELIGKRKRDGQVGFTESYRKFALPVEGVHDGSDPGDLAFRVDGAVDVCDEVEKVERRCVDGEGTIRRDGPNQHHLAKTRHSGERGNGWFVLHPSFNPTGTSTLRWSSKNPNLQQVSKKESGCERCEGEGTDARGEPCSECGGSGKDVTSLRHVFGPLPGREWWCMDYENIELRIPAYESGEPAMIELFEKPDEPPYFGSYHLLNASIVYTDEFNAPACPDCAGTRKNLKSREPCSCSMSKVPLCMIKGGFKALYPDTLYQYDKNGGFAMQYQCQERKADATFRRKGAYRALKEKLPRVADLSAHWIRFAERNGYVETIPDRTVNPRRGYPLLCTRTDDGYILPTVPLSYHIQSTAMQATKKAMVRGQAQLDAWNVQASKAGRMMQRMRDGMRRGAEALGYCMVLQCHDEIVFEMPKVGDPVVEQKAVESGKKLTEANATSNLWRVQILRNLMSKSGDDIGVPTPVSLTYCPETWSEGVTF